MKSFTHFILTRFNLRVDYANPGTGLDQQWLNHRFNLFEQFCYPSVREQSNQNFKWLVFFDSQTPEFFKNKIEKYSEWKNFIPVYIDGEITDCIYRAKVLSNLAAGSEYLITTRLDNDDAICKDFVKIIQENFHEQEFEFINFTYGYVLRGVKLYLYKYLNNPFMSLIERINELTVNGFKTIFCGKHNELSSMGCIIQSKTTPTWLQVIHERNIDNRVRGIRQPLKRLNDEFSINIGSISLPENQLMFWLEKSLNIMQFIIFSTLKFLLSRNKINHRLSKN